MTAILRAFRVWSLAFLVSLALICRGSGEELDLKGALARLPSLKSVDGSAVGAAGTPGGFYLLSKAILEKGDQALFTKLLSDSSPAARCMGLYCKAHSGDADAVKVLVASLSDSAVIEYCPLGCIVGNSSVGGFAYSLLLNQDCLTTQEPRPMIGDGAIETLSINALANDSYCHLYEECRRELCDRILTSDDGPTLVALRSKVPSVYVGTLMKAIGRLDQDNRIKRVLLECVQDRDSDKMARMTAWSALTRYDSPEIQVAAEANLKTLNELEPGFGTLIERSISVCREHAAQMVPVKKERTWRGMEAIEDKVILAYSMAEPVALNDLLQSSGLAIVHDHPEVKKTVLASLTALGKKQTSYDQVWCTFSDYPNLLREFIRVQRQNRYSVWSENDLKQIETNL